MYIKKSTFLHFSVIVLLLPILLLIIPENKKTPISNQSVPVASVPTYTTDIGEKLNLDYATSLYAEPALTSFISFPFTVIEQTNYFDETTYIIKDSLQNTYFLRFVGNSLKDIKRDNSYGLSLYQAL